MRTLAIRLLAGTALLGVAALTAAAQERGVRWHAFYGCWSAAAPLDPFAAAAPVVCITPTADEDVATITTVAPATATKSQRVDAAREQPIGVRDCTGTQQAHWSNDGRRLFLRSRSVCGGVPRVSSGIFALAANGDWLDIQGVVVGEGEQVRVARYRDVGIPSTVPAEIAEALRDRTVASDAQRIIAAEAARPSDVAEAARNVSTAVAEAWVLERGQAFSLDASQLVALADAGVPGKVTDAMIAVSNPTVFAISHSEIAERPRSARDTTVVAGRRLYVTVDPFYSPWDWGYASSLGYGRSYGYYSPYGYGLPYYGYPQSAYGYYGAPVIVGSGPPVLSPTHGRIVKGQGYTPPPSSSSATSARPSSSSTPSGSSSAGASSAGASSAGSSSSAASAPRTAHQRP